MRFLPALAALLLAGLTPTQAAPDAAPVGTLTTDSGLTYSAWLPTGFAAHHHDVPLVLFSHGFGGCAQQSSMLTQALADAGYAVLAPNHKDSTCTHSSSGWFDGVFALVTGKGPDIWFGADTKWNATTEAGRRDDMDAMLNYALSHAPYRQAIDPSRVAAMGHSLGGYTVLGLGGAWPSWRDPRIKAVLALAPFVAPFIDRKTLSRIAVPVMVEAGADDSAVTPSLLADGGYAMIASTTGAPKFLVLLKGAGHFAFTDREPKYQPAIAAYAIGFFDRTLRQKPAPLLDAAPAGLVTAYRHTP